MSALEDINPSNPVGSTSLGQGDNEIRALKAKLLEWALIGHFLTGEHSFGIGNSASRPVAGKAGNLYVLTEAGVSAELQYDTGTAWVTLTSNQTVISYAANLSTHQLATTIDHPDDSVTSAKILKGAIVKKHLDGSTDNNSLADLVNGSANGDSFHTHPQSIVTTDANIDWANATAVSQGSVYLNNKTYAAWGWQSVQEIRVEIPANATYLYYDAYIKGSGNVEVRLTHTTQGNGTATSQVNSATYTWTTTKGAIALGTLTGAQTFTIEIQQTDGTTPNLGIDFFHYLLG